MNATERADRAHELGRQAGAAAGSWVIDGNTSSETAARLIQGYDDGDPQVMDIEPAALSGEWADSPTPQSLAAELELGDDEQDSELDQLCTDFELGFSEGFWAEVIRAAQVIAA